MSNRSYSISVLSYEKEHVDELVRRLNKMNVDYIHYDIMDEKFIGHTSFSLEDSKKITDNCLVKKDVHLMVMNPYEYAKEYAKFNPDYITFHYEAFKDNETRFDCIKAFRKLNVKVGISINPATECEKVLPFLDFVDLVLIMSVVPGKGGQAFIDTSLEKIRKCKDYISLNNLNTLIEVDGGVKDINAKACFDAGADILVVGSYLTKSEDMEERYKKLSSLL